MLYHYTSGFYAARMIHSKYLFASDPRSFNDPFEIKIRVDEKSFTPEVLEGIFQKHDRLPPDFNSLKETTKVTKNVFVVRDTFLEIASRQFSIICFSCLHDSIPMWSQYGYKHSGVVLGFNEEKSPILKDARKVEYVSDPVLYRHETDDKSMEDFYKIMSTKHESWCTEKEYRMLVPNELLKKDGHFYFENFIDALSEVYFGCRCSEYDIHTVILYCKSQRAHCRFFQSKVDEETYKLKFEEIVLHEDV